MTEMIALTEALADDLARAALDLAHRLENDTVPERVAEALGAESAALLTAYGRALELRRAEAHARAVLDEMSSGTSPV